MIAEQLRPILSEARPYPAHLLNAGETGLALFSAAFLGWNDVVHFARKGLTCTCVDRDAVQLAEMAARYPSDWRFVVSDAWEYVEAATAEGLSWDVVTVDPFMGNAAERVWATLDSFLALAGRLATVTVPSDWSEPAPDGWRQTLFPRAQGVSWLVMRRA